MLRGARPGPAGEVPCERGAGAGAGAGPAHGVPGPLQAPLSKSTPPLSARPCVHSHPAAHPNFLQQTQVHAPWLTLPCPALPALAPLPYPQDDWYILGSKPDEYIFIYYRLAG
jgi:hypothetical protein